MEHRKIVSYNYPGRQPDDLAHPDFVNGHGTMTAGSALNPEKVGLLMGEVPLWQVTQVVSHFSGPSWTCNESQDESCEPLPPATYNYSEDLAHPDFEDGHGTMTAGPTPNPTPVGSCGPMSLRIAYRRFLQSHVPTMQKTSPVQTSRTVTGP